MPIFYIINVNLKEEHYLLPIKYYQISLIFENYNKYFMKNILKCNDILKVYNINKFIELFHKLLRMLIIMYSEFLKMNN